MTGYTNSPVDGVDSPESVLGTECLVVEAFLHDGLVTREDKSPVGW